MSELIPIKVECHAGYKADEYPVRFSWEGALFEIHEILDRWYQGDTSPEFMLADYYKVQTSTSGQFILKHEIESDRWFLVI